MGGKPLEQFRLRGFSLYSLSLKCVMLPVHLILDWTT